MADTLDGRKLRSSPAATTGSATRAIVPSVVGASDRRVTGSDLSRLGSPSGVLWAGH